MTMRIVIRIPEEFEEHFNADRFEDGLHRLSADAHLIAGNYEQETAIMLINALKDAKLLPKSHDYIDRNNAITSICQHYTTCERIKMLSFTPNLIKQEVTDILCAEPTIIEADKED